MTNDQIDNAAKVIVYHLVNEINALVARALAEQAAEIERRRGLNAEAVAELQDSGCINH
jgi:hypothetical protein